MTDWRAPAGLTKPRSTEEADLQASISGEAERLGWLVFHPRISIGSQAGYPDLTLVRPPRLIFSECKSMTGTRSPAQKTWRDTLVKLDTGAVAVAGDKCPSIEVYLWRPDEWEDGTILKVLA